MDAGRWLVSAVLVSLVSLAVVPGVVVAADRVGPAVVVEAGERVDGLTATGGRVVVRGTVAGDLDAYAGSVVVAETGTVTGSVTAVGGSVRVEGDVGGNVVAYAGSVTQTETAVVEGSVGAVAGDVSVAGRVRGDVTVATGLLRLRSPARVGGDVTHDGRLRREAGVTVDGRVRRTGELGLGPAPPALPPGTALVFGVCSNLLFGALLIVGLEDFSAAVAETAVLDVVASARHAVVGVVALPVVVVGLVLTVVGIPVALVTALALPLVGWVSALYGRLAVGGWLLSLADVDDRWRALAVGVVVVAVLGRVPFRVGLGVRALVTLLGFGAVAVELRDRLGEGGRL